MTQKQIQELLKKTQTPFYVYDLKELENRVNYIKQFLPDRVDLCYAVKANSFILQKISKMVNWLEICSPGEYRICKSLGLPESQFVISGVYKEKALTEKMITEDEKIGCYTIESRNQFFLLQDAAQKANRTINVLFRLTSGNQFGLDENDIFELVKEHRNDQWLNILGIQYYSGTQKYSLKKLKRETEYLDKVISKISEKCSFQISKLEYGPGFPVPYFEEDLFNEPEFLKQFINIILNMRYSGAITLELGRSLTATCGTYYTKVVDKKCNNQSLFAIVDGGMHHIVYHGQSMAMKHPVIKPFPQREEGNIQEWNICGSLCTVNDILVKRHPLANLQTGDILAFENAGAYCVTEGNALFLSRDLPGVLLLEESGAFKLARMALPTEYLNTLLDV